MDDILVVDEDLVDINCDGNRQSDNKKGKHSSGGRMVSAFSEETCSTALRRLLPVSLSFLTEQPFRVFQFREKHTTRQKKLLKKRKKALLSLLIFRLM